MSNSQEQSLDENAVFAPVPETSPEFFHCEKERYALESLLSLGPGAFYTQLEKEHLDPFLSRQEVEQLSAWTQDYSSSSEGAEPSDDKGANPDELSPGVDDLSMCYWPTFSDTIPPDLELGWPDRDSWAQPGGVHIYTNPPMPQTPPIREVIRSLIQGARKVIAIVTDRLTDSHIISDLCSAASRGVPVYIILNHRSAQDTDPPHKLRHPNIRVRILEGKSFCSREGKMVTGELRENFFMFDLEAVMLGSYSPTWTDAHLHRQLVVLLLGPVVISFDQEFRILYAASQPAPDTLLVAPPLKRRTSDRACPQYKPHHQLNGLSPLCDMTSPPPSDFIVDWDSLGLTNYKFSIDEVVSPPWQWRDPSLGLPSLVEKNMSVQRRLQRSGAHLWMDQRKVHHESLCRRTNQLSSEKKETTLREEPLSRSTNQRVNNEEGLPMSHRKGSFLEQGLNYEFDINSGVSKRVPKASLCDCPLSLSKYLLCLCSHPTLKTHNTTM